MEELNKLRARIEAWLTRLNPRERLLVTAVAGGVVVFILVIISVSVGSAISAREARIASKTRALSQIGKLMAGYHQAQAERLSLESRLKSQQVPLMSFISQTGGKLGIEVNDLRPGGTPSTSGGIQEESVEVTLPKLDLAKLSKLLQEINNSPQLFAKVRRLSIRTRTDDPALVDATLVIATFQLKS
jgi:general secretion pathway protein M